MASLTSLSLQAFLVTLVYSSSYADKKSATLDGVINAMGAFYQNKLYDMRDNSEEIDASIDDLDHDPCPGYPSVEILNLPMQKICLSNFPLCLFVSTTIRTGKKFSTENKVMRKASTRDQGKVCYSDIVFGTCPDLNHPLSEIDVSGLKVNDFCVPGTMEINGTLEISTRIGEEATLYFELENETMRSARPPNATSDSPCITGGSYCRLLKLCKVMAGDDCGTPWRSYDAKFPCSCPVEPGTYQINKYMKTFNEPDDIIGFGRKKGYILVLASGKMSCFSIQFTRSEV